MGFDIEIVRVKKKIDTSGNIILKSCKRMDRTYISYNWSKFCSICFDHIFNETQCRPCKCTNRTVKCECDACIPTYVWYFKTECHARCGLDVAERAKRSLQILFDNGVQLGIPDRFDCNWSYGVREFKDESGKYMTVQLPPRERLEVFACHLNMFVELGNEYPECYFIGDHDSDVELIMPDGLTVKYIEHKSENKDSDDESDNESDDSVDQIYVEHPVKGTILIDNFKSAMEIYGLKLYEQDSTAEKWYRLAMSMYDAPGK